MRHPVWILTISWCVFFAVSQSVPAGGCCAGSGTSRTSDGGGDAASPRRTAVVSPDHVLTVGGMACASCEAPVRRGPAAVAGVMHVEAAYAQGLARVWGDDSVSDPRDLVGAVERAGFEATAQEHTQLRLVGRHDPKRLSRLEDQLRRTKGVAYVTKGSTSGSPSVVVWHAPSIDRAEVARVATATGARVEIIATDSSAGSALESEAR